MPDHAPQQALKGVLLVLAATLTFSAADVLTKRLVSLYGVPFVSCLRYLINVTLLAAIYMPRHGLGLFVTRRHGLVALRALALAAGTLTMGLALQRMPVGETVAIIYLSPFLVMLLAIPILGERVSLAGWIGAALGFLGVLLIVRPGSGLAVAGVVFALINAGCAASYTLLSRVLSRSESTMALLFFTALLGLLVFAVLVPFNLPDQLPGPRDSLAILALGVLATLGHFLFTSAYRLAPASLLAPVNYMHLVFAAGLGWLVFGHMPAAMSLLGMAMVAAAGVWIALRARGQK